MELVENAFELGEPLDKFATLAEGHYARVYEVNNGQKQPRALKVLRIEHVEEGHKRNPAFLRKRVDAFRHEVRALYELRDTATITRFYECGFIEYPRDLLELKLDDLLKKQKPLPNYRIVRFKPTPSDLKHFFGNTDSSVAQGWLPYIVVEQIPRRFNMAYYIDPQGKKNQFRCSIGLALEMMYQAVVALAELHNRGYVYYDHKVAHMCWDWDSRRLRIIDWNAGHFLEGMNLAEQGAYKREDMKELVVQVMYSLLTGDVLDEQNQVGPAEERGRSHDIKELPLPNTMIAQDILQAFLNRACSKEFADAEEMRQGIESLMCDYGFPCAERENKQYLQAREACQAAIASYLDLRVELQSILTQYKHLGESVPPHIYADLYDIEEIVDKMLRVDSILR